MCWNVCVDNLYVEVCVLIICAWSARVDNLYLNACAETVLEMWNVCVDNLYLKCVCWNCAWNVCVETALEMCVLKLQLKCVRWNCTWNVCVETVLEICELKLYVKCVCIQTKLNCAGLLKASLKVRKNCKRKSNRKSDCKMRFGEAKVLCRGRGLQVYSWCMYLKEIRGVVYGYNVDFECKCV